LPDQIFMKGKMNNAIKRLIKQQGCRVEAASRKESEVLGWSRIPNNTGSRSRIFFPTPDVQLDHFLHHTLKLGIPVETVQ